MSATTATDQLTPARADKQALIGATTVRFLLLLFLLLVTSLSMVSELTKTISIPGIYEHHDISAGCELAAGEDPSSAAAAPLLRAATSYWRAYRACLAHYGWSPPWWAPLALTAGLAVAVMFLCWEIPAWKGRARRVTPVAGIEGAAGLEAGLADIVAAAGLAGTPRFVIDPAARTASAIVFGRSRPYTVCLHGGLVARRSADPAGFRAVILHELAHIKNRDVGITYATVAAWRVFLVAVLLPYTVNTTTGLLTAPTGQLAIFTPVARPIFVREALLSALLVALVYLVRADILRTREARADIDAVRWGAEPSGWHPGPRDGRRRGPTGRALAAFAGLWRTHPTWERRRAALAGPPTALGPAGLQMFLTGASAAILNDRLSGFLGGIVPVDPGNQIAALLTAAVVATIVGVEQWRGARQSLLAGRTPRPGLIPGSWLGAGLVFGEYLVFSTVGSRALPPYPEVLLVLVLIAVLVTGLAAELAELWSRPRPGRGELLGLLLTLASAWLVFSYWLGWYQISGVLIGNGSLLVPGSFVSTITRGAPAAAVAAQHGVLVAFSAVLLIVHSGSGGLLLAAGTALCLVPLLAVARRPGRVTAYRLGTVTVAAVAGAVVCLAAAVAVTAYLHSQRTPSGAVGYYSYVWWLGVALVAGMVTAAAVAAARARRCGMATGLAAAGITSLAGFAEIFLLVGTEGCVGPLTTAPVSCGWHPYPAWLLVTPLVPIALGLGTLVAGAAALLAGAGARVVRARAPASASRWRPAGSRGWHAARWTGAALICAAAVGVAMTGWVVDYLDQGPAAAGQQAPADQQAQASPSGPATPALAREQAAAWVYFGGRDLILGIGAVPHFSSAVDQFAAALQTHQAPVAFHTAAAPLASVCAAVGSDVSRARGYFPVPIPAQQAQWAGVLAGARQASSDCERALSQESVPQLQRALNEMVRTARSDLHLMQRLSTVMQRG